MLKTVRGGLVSGEWTKEVVTMSIQDLTGIFSILQPQTWPMYCFFQENLLHPTVTQAAGDKIWHRTQRGSFVTSTFGWDPHHWIPHLGLIHNELARSWTHCSEWELKTADEAGVLWMQASATLSTCKRQWRRRRGSHTDLAWERS